MRPVRVIFLGPPGTGKGTQARRLSERLGLAALSSGDTLRREIKEGSEIGRQAERHVVSGGLVPDEIITRVMLAGIAKLGSNAGYVLDGFPRTTPQAEALEQGLNARGQRIDGVLDFELADAEIIARIVGRRVCSQCGATYNIAFLPPRRADVCDACGGGLAQRADDREDVIRTRLETYRAQTAPLIGHYADQGLLFRIDASGPAETVERAVVETVRALAEGE